MPRTFVKKPILSDPTWIAQHLTHQKLISGAKVKKHDFSLDAFGRIPLKSGTVLMRREGTRLFLKATTNLRSRQPTILTIPAQLGSTVINVRDADFKVGDTIRFLVNAVVIESRVISSIDFLSGTINLSTALTNSYAVANTVVENSININIGSLAAGHNLLISAFTNRDLNVTNDIELVEKDTAVYINYLPDWNGTNLISTTVEDEIRQLYHCLLGVV